jgi:hypothetical protein
MSSKVLGSDLKSGSDDPIKTQPIVTGDQILRI